MNPTKEFVDEVKATPMGDGTTLWDHIQVVFYRDPETEMLNIIREEIEARELQGLPVSATEIGNDIVRELRDAIREVVSRQGVSSKVKNPKDMN